MKEDAAAELFKEVVGGLPKAGGLPGEELAERTRQWAGHDPKRAVSLWILSTIGLFGNKGLRKFLSPEELELFTETLGSLMKFILQRVLPTVGEDA